jgi:hypothetical protein
MNLNPRHLRDRWRGKHPYYRRAERNWYTLPAPDLSEADYSVLLIGDMGMPALESEDPILRLINQEMRLIEDRTTVLFLGDVVYPRGLPPEGHRLREISEKRLKVQLDLFPDFKGKVHFLSGNHDWNKGRSNGYSYALRQEEYVEQYLKQPDVYLPDQGCPGPVLIDLTEEVLLIVINTQWWVQRGLRPVGKLYNCQAKNETHFLQLLNQAFAENRHRKILVAAHHPLYSNALHGGKFTMKHHLFPLTAAHKKLYIPIPFAGSLYPLYRRFFGAHEDMSHPRYRRMRRGLLSIFKHHRNLIYAAGHDHNLQYFEKGSRHFIVSGSGSKTSYVHKGGKASFVHAHKGFFRIDFMHNGDVWMSVLEPDLRSETQSAPGLVMFRKKLSMERVEDRSPNRFSPAIGDF